MLAMVKAYCRKLICGTLTPTQSPTATPTIAPSSCADLDGIQSNDGTDIIANTTIYSIDNKFAVVSGRNVSDKYNLTDGDFYENVGSKTIIDCSLNMTDDQHPGICYIKCDLDSAFKSCGESIVVAEDRDVAEFIMECSGKYSCYRSGVNLTRSNFENVSIICSEPGSCRVLRLMLKI